MVDRFSNWPIVKQVSSASNGAKLLQTTLRHVFATYGIPVELTSDGGPEFTAHTVWVQNQRGNNQTRWDKSSIITRCGKYDQYWVKMDDSGYTTKRNRRYLRLATREHLPPIPNVIPLATVPVEPSCPLSTSELDNTPEATLRPPPPDPDPPPPSREDTLQPARATPEPDTAPMQAHGDLPGQWAHRLGKGTMS